MPTIRTIAHSSFGQLVFDFALGLGSHYRGIYASLEQARAAAPASRQFGYDNPQAAKLYRRHIQLRWGDHAVLYWLSQTMAPASRLFDIGGNIGISFYAFEPYLHYPPEFQWRVYELPAAVELGRRFQQENPRSQLAFTTSLDDMAECDLVLASGALQYIDWNLADEFANRSHRPQHVLINKLPMYDGPEFVTLQDIGPTICAYRIFNQKNFMHSLEQLGYELVDQWEIGDLQCRIPFHPSRTVRAYRGMYFKLR
jgi:putative methyltransferase (TIGR04325 family)